MRPAAEIHAYLVEQLNGALRRPGMYGDESALRLIIRHLTYVEGSDDLGEWQEAMRAGGASYSTGVTGAVGLMLPDRPMDVVTSVYAEFARLHQWLELDRELTIEEYGAMRDQLADWCAEDRRLQDVRAAFGPPSVLFGGQNPKYSKTLGYATERPSDPMISFHLWNGSQPDDPETAPEYEEPVLLAARCGNTPFEKCLVYTPEGARRRPALPDWYERKHN
jgi:hypothetical protein